jgi:hypothetical protein
MLLPIVVGLSLRVEFDNPVSIPVRRIFARAEDGLAGA